MRNGVRIVFILVLLLASEWAAAVPVIKVRLALFSEHATGVQHAGRGWLTVVGLPFGVDDPWFFDGPGSLVAFEFGALPDSSDQWQVGLDTLHFLWGDMASDGDGIVEHLSFIFGPSAIFNDGWYLFANRVPGTANELSGGWNIGLAQGFLTGRTVPEPASLALLLAGLGSWAVTRRRRRSN